jgi:hypothetical protein
MTDLKKRGRPRKESPDNVELPEEPTMGGETVIGQPPPTVKVKQNGKFTTSELAEKLNILLGGAARMGGYEYQYESVHYNQEAAGLLRLIEKYPEVGKIVILFDPLLIVFGIIGKFKNLIKKKKEEKKDQNNQSQQSPPPPSVPVYNLQNRSMPQ